MVREFALTPLDELWKLRALCIKIDYELSHIRGLHILQNCKFTVMEQELLAAIGQELIDVIN